MEISDIIVLLSVIIAIIAILSEKNRQHVLLKFNKIDIAVYIVGFILINYFTFYQTFYENGWIISWLTSKILVYLNPNIGIT
jgi:hypothetical protein